MTRIGVFSDSHGDRDALERLLEEMGHVDAACFLGDISSDAMFLREKLEEMPHQPVLYAVRGNNDLASMLPDQLLIGIGRPQNLDGARTSGSKPDDARVSRKGSWRRYCAFRPYA